MCNKIFINQNFQHSHHLKHINSFIKILNNLNVILITVKKFLSTKGKFKETP